MDLRHFRLVLPGEGGKRRRLTFEADASLTVPAQLHRRGLAEYEPETVATFLAALDVLDREPIPADHPLWRRPNVFMTPHLAWYSEEALAQLQRSVGEECARVLRGQPPKNPVNAKELGR